MINNPIIINQRLPLAILELALVSHLKEEYSKEYVMEQLAVEFEGENRLKKAFDLVNKTILYNPLESYISENRNLVLTALKKREDRNTILISIVNSTFPFSFDTLSAFGKYFNVQDIISTEAIKKTVAAKYGGNRSMENGLYCVIPMFLEAGFFNRQKPGVYESTPAQSPSAKISVDLYKESFRINRNKQEILELDITDPYFFFLTSEAKSNHLNKTN